MKKLFLIVVITMLFCGLFTACDAPSRTIHYILNGGVNHENNIEIIDELEDNFILKPATKDGYAFEGWYDSASAGNKITEIDKNITQNITLYARWVKTYNINYVLDGGTNNQSNITQYSMLNNEFVLISPEKYGFTFNGWYDSQNFENKVTSIDPAQKSDINLYASWSVDPSFIGNLPLIKINTENRQLPYDKENYINCSFEISNCADESYNFAIDMADVFDDEEDDQ